MHPPRSTAEQRAAWPVVLVSMPFMEVYRPSIQIALLKAIGEAHGFTIRTLHAYLDLAELATVLLKHKRFCAPCGTRRKLNRGIS